MFSISPKQLFLIDCFGALTSSFLLGVLLVSYQAYLGIPTSNLYFMASVPILFAFYDLVCLLVLKHNFQPFLKIIASLISLIACFQ